MKCQINTHSIKISRKPFTDQIMLTRCCYKHQEITKLYNINEVINNNNFIDDVLNSASIMPVNHDYTVYPHFCKTNEKKCDYSSDKINSIEIATTYACNLKCIMCGYRNFVDNINFLLDKQLYFHILNNIKNHHLETITLTTEGEPFFYKKETLDYLQSLTSNDTKNVFIISNLTLLDENDIYILKNINDKDVKIHIMASIDAISEETYKKIRKNNNFNKVINNVKLLNALNLLHSINYVIMPENLYELDFLYDFYKNININSSKINYLVFNGDDTEETRNKINFILNSNEYKRFINL
jgi:MoaA/NifB/PqqE/SkfB family radical SAM enzyme